MNRLLLVFIILVFGVQTAEASQYFSRLTRNDGTEIYKCVDGSGNVDYCTAYDRNNAEAITKNPSKYSIVSEVQISADINKTSTLTKTGQAAQTFGESCMNVQYAVGTGMTLFNSVVGAVDTIRYAFR